MTEDDILREVISQATHRQHELLMPQGLRGETHRGWAIKVRNMIEPLTNPSNYATSTEANQKVKEFPQALKENWESGASSEKRSSKKATRGAR